MTSPLATYATATLVFEQPTGALSAGALGTPETATTPLIVVAFLKQKRADQFSASDPRPDGQDSDATVEGYLITPSLLPAAIKPGQAAACTFWRVGMGNGFVLPSSFVNQAALTAFEAANAAHIAQQGQFILEANIPGGFGVEAILGDKLRGQFVTRVSWIDEL